MLKTLDLTKASNSMYSGIDIVQRSFEDLSRIQVPKIRKDIAGLDSSSPAYHLRMKAVTELFEKTRQDVRNLSNIITSTSAVLQKTSLGLKGLEQEVRLMELDHEMAVAGRFEKAYLKVARGINTIYSSVLSISDFFKVDQPTTAVVGTAILSGAVSFSAGYLYANKDSFIGNTF